MSDIGTILDTISKRAEAATPGPWEFENRPDNQFVNAGNINICALAGIFAHTEDFQFIAAARTDVPALDKALRRAMECVNYMAVSGTFCTRALETKDEIASILSGGKP
jgi:hypothetical protein